MPTFSEFWSMTELVGLIAVLSFGVVIAILGKLHTGSAWSTIGSLFE